MLHMASHKGYMYDAMHMYGGSVIGSHEPVEQMKVQIQGRFKNRTIARLQYLRVETSIYRKKKILCLSTSRDNTRCIGKN